MLFREVTFARGGNISRARVLAGTRYIVEIIGWKNESASPNLKIETRQDTHMTIARYVCHAS